MASNNRTHIPAACTTTHLIRPLQRTIRRTRISAADRTHIPCHLSYYTTASHVLIRLQTSALTTMCAAALSAQVRPLRPTALASLPLIRSLYFIASFTTDNLIYCQTIFRISISTPSVCALLR